MKKHIPLFKGLLKIITITVLMCFVLLRGCRSALYESKTVSTFGTGNTKCLPDGRIVFQIIYRIYHRPQGLATFPDGGMPWINDFGLRTYLYQPGQALQTIPFSAIPPEAIHFKNDYAAIGGFCSAETTKQFYVSDEVKAAGNKFLTIIDNHREVHNYSYSELFLPDPAAYNGEFSKRQDPQNDPANSSEFLR